jgi:hypothetical protein
MKYKSYVRDTTSPRKLKKKAFLNYDSEERCIKEVAYSKTAEEIKPLARKVFVSDPHLLTVNLDNLGCCPFVQSGPGFGPSFGLFMKNNFTVFV